MPSTNGLSPGAGGEPLFTEPRPWIADDTVVAAAEAVFEDSGLENARSIDGLLGIVSRRTGKPLHVRLVEDESLVTTTAIWVEFPTHSLIVLRRQDRPYYQARGLFHEVGHIVFRHPACTVLNEDPRLERYTRDGGQIRGRVLISEANLPSLYGKDRHETEAEAVAILIGRQILQPRFRADETVFA